MFQSDIDQTELKQLNQAIHAYIEARLQAKLEKLKADDDEKRRQLIEEYQTVNWLDNAAIRVKQIQQVTHAQKFSHPDAKGNSLYAPGNRHAGHLLLGTHTISNDLRCDTVGNAAALDVSKFLNIMVNNKTLLQRISEQDAAILAVFTTLTDDKNKIATWLQNFADITKPNNELMCHTLSRQLLWPIANNHYHILAPLFPTSTVQVVWEKIHHSIFSQANKQARDAKKAMRLHAYAYQYYPNLVIQQFGGSKPQNISQLNSERHGENYLLASFPPNWQTGMRRPPFNIDSIFSNWLSARPRMRKLLNMTKQFLKNCNNISAENSKSYNNIDIRQSREKLISAIMNEVLEVAAELQALTPAWSDNTQCRLNQAEQCWLDPGRAGTDEGFCQLYDNSDWQQQVAQRFGNWLNARLENSKHGIYLDQDSANAWKKALQKQLSA